MVVVDVVVVEVVVVVNVVVKIIREVEVANSVVEVTKLKSDEEINIF